MAEDIPPQVIKETQTLLGKYIKEPRLTEKLLKKPPFRFLQDIIKSVVKETGFLGDVFTADEIMDNIKEKDKKVAFLKKLISAIHDATGATINVKPSKIVAGLEVTKTLLLLQAVATGIALQQSDTTIKPPLIEETRNNKDSATIKDKKPKSKIESDGKIADSAKSKKKKPEIKEKNVSREKNREKSAKKATDKNYDKEEANIIGASEEKKRDKPAKCVNSGENETDEASKNVIVEEQRRAKSGKEKKSKERPSSWKPAVEGLDQATSHQNVTVLQEGNKENSDRSSNLHSEIPSLLEIKSSSDVAGANDFEESKENAKPLSGSIKSSLDSVIDKGDKDQRERKEKSERRESKDGGLNERKTSSRRASSNVRSSSKSTEKSEKLIKEKVKQVEGPALLGSGEAAINTTKVERPQTARKPPPSARPQSVRPPSTKPGAKIRDRGEVKTDLHEQAEKEMKEVSVISDAERLQDDENTVTVERQAMSPDFDAQGSNFLERGNKVGENEGALVAQILETTKELEETGQIISGDPSQRNTEIEWEGGRKQKKEAWGREIVKLREGIQQLTRSTNPLGKLFDFLQEDVDSMQRDHKMWKEMNASYSKQLENERRLTNNSLEKYRRQLAEVDSLIEQETETLKNMKANVLANDRKMYSLMTKTSTE